LLRVASWSWTLRTPPRTLANLSQGFITSKEEPQPFPFSICDFPHSAVSIVDVSLLLIQHRSQLDQQHQLWVDLFLLSEGLPAQLGHQMEPRPNQQSFGRG
jgi:hypothetical protein